MVLNNPKWFTVLANITIILILILDYISTDFKLFHYYGLWVHDDQWLCSLWGGVYKSATPLAVSGESSNHQTLCTSGLSVNIFVTSCYLVVLWEAAQGIIVCGAVAAGLQSRKPLVPMIIETVTSWQLIWEPASPLHQSLVWTLSLTPTIWKQEGESSSRWEKPMAAVGALLSHPERFQPDFAKWRGSVAVNYTFFSRRLPICSGMSKKMSTLMHFGWQRCCKILGLGWPS